MTAAYRSHADASATLGNPIVVTKPAGTVDGDLLVAVGGGTGAITAPAGWTTHAASLGTTVPLWTKVAASEGASYSFTQTATQTGVVTIVCISDAGSVDDADGVQGTGVLVIPSVDSAAADRLLLQVVNKRSAIAITWAGPGSQTEQYDAAVGAPEGRVAAGTETVGSGATGTRTWTPSGGALNGVGYQLAIASSSINTTVTVPAAATATAAGQVPTVTGGATATVPAAATATAAGQVPTVFTEQMVAIVVPSAALATGQGQVPTITAQVLQTSISNLARLRAAAALSIIEPTLSTKDTGWLLREYWGRRAGIVGDLSTYSINDIIAVHFPGSHFIRDVV